MLPRRQPNKFLISVLDVEEKFKGRYHKSIDDNLNLLIVSILRDRADRLIPVEFRDTSLDIAGLGSHLMACLKDIVTFPEHLDIHEELIELIDEVAYLFECYDIFKGKLVRVHKTGQYGHVYIEILGTINDTLIEHYKEQLIELIKGEVTNPLQVET